MMKHEGHGRNRIRLLAMHHLQLGKSFKEISAIVKSHWKTVQSWLRRFRNHGFEGLFESLLCASYTSPLKTNLRQLY